jgi:large subunit ribosomal protein L25
MAEQMTLAVEKRTATGKGPNRRLRAAGLIPGVYYNSTGENIQVQVKELPLQKTYQKLGVNHVFQLEIDDAGQKTHKPALFWKILNHPFKNQVLHVDFYGVDLTKELKLMVPVEITGESVGVKKGGKLDVYRDQIEVLCLPLSIPDKIVIDVTDLEISKAVHVADLVLPQGVKAIYDSNFTVVGVNMPTEEAEETPAKA